VIVNINSVGTYTCPLTSATLTLTELYNAQPIPWELPMTNWYTAVRNGTISHFSATSYSSTFGYVRFGCVMGAECGGLGMAPGGTPLWPYAGSTLASLRAQYLSFVNTFFASIQAENPSWAAQHWATDINTAGINGSGDASYADQEAILSNEYGAAQIGNQDYELNDVLNLLGTGPNNCTFPLAPATPGSPACTQGNWAYNFSAFPGMAHELQELHGSTPLNCGSTGFGPLAPLPSGSTYCSGGFVGMLPFLVTLRTTGVSGAVIPVQIFEVNTQGSSSGTGSPTQSASDTLLTLDPTYSLTTNAVAAYFIYQAAYQLAWCEFLGVGCFTVPPSYNNAGILLSGN
jgi:hypothetical protein